MSAKIVVGPVLPGPDPKRQVTVNVSLTDPSNMNSDAAHIKIVLNRVDDESDEQTLKRAVRRARELAEQISNDIANNNFGYRS